MKKKITLNILRYILVLLILDFFSERAMGQPSLDLEADKNDPSIQEMMKLDIEELSVSVASKREESISEAPGIITVITTEEIEKFGGNNLGEVLSRLPNTYRYASTALRDNSTTIRGQQINISDNKSLILLNGRPMRDSLTGGNNMAFYRAIPLGIIERIEMVRGPGSVLYGTNALAGAINVITKNPGEYHPNEISAGYGVDNTSQASGLFGEQFGDLKLLVSGKYLESDGWDFLINDSNGNTMTDDFSEKNYGVTGVAQYKNFSLTGFTGFKRDTTFNLNNFQLAGEKEKLLRNFWDLQYEYSFENKLKATANITYNGFNFTNNLGSDFDFNDLLYEISIGGELFNRFNFISGFIYQRLDGTLQNGTISYTNDRFNYYTQADYKPWQFLKLIAGFNVSKPEGIDFNVTPRFGAIAQMTDQVGIKLLYGEAFRSPFSAEQSLNNPFLKGNPNLQPEDAKTFNAQIFYNAPKIYTALTYYVTQLDGAIQAGSGTFLNSEQIDFEGVEWEWKIHPVPGWLLTGSLSHQTNEDLIGNQDVGLVPNGMAKIGVSYESPEGYSVGVFNSYFGDAASITSAPNTNPDADAYNWLTLKGELELAKFLPRAKIPNVALNLFVDNVLDEDVFFPDSLFRRTNTIPLRRGIGIFGGATVRF
jgi:outer membrane receptor for ferrienterochelin and colicins